MTSNEGMRTATLRAAVGPFPRLRGGSTLEGTGRTGRFRGPGAAVRTKGITMMPSFARPARRALALFSSVAVLVSAPVLGAATASGSVASAGPTGARLVEVRAAHHAGFDRVVLEFDSRAAPRARVTSVRTSVTMAK